jgi:uncharacterized protein
MLDVESGAIHRLDETAYKTALALEHNADPYRLSYPKTEIDEVLGEFKQLQAAGMFQSARRETYTPGLYQGGGGVVKSICLHVAHDCNLRCKYCFADTGEFHGKRELMSVETGKQALDFLIAHAGARKNLEVDLFGGEPLLNMETIKVVVKYGRRLEKLHDKTIHFTITTNGVALNGGLIEYINAEMHNVVLSIDGRRKVHDAMRPNIAGKGSYDAILPRFKALLAGRGEKEHYVRGTFTNRNIDFTEDIKALREEGFTWISMEPVVLDEASPYALRKEHIPAILEEYDKLCALLAQSEQEGKPFHFFHFMLDMEGGPCLRKRLTGCGAGNEYVAVSPEGDIYPCHQFVGEREYVMGNVATGALDQTMQQAFQGCTVLAKPACNACWSKYYCSGGCAANAYKYNGDIYRPEEMSCILLKKRTECAIGLAMMNSRG